MYTNSLGQYFDKLSLNAASCQTADSTIFVCILIEPELKYLKIWRGRNSRILSKNRFSNIDYQNHKKNHFLYKNKYIIIYPMIFC